MYANSAAVRRLPAPDKHRRSVKATSCSVAGSAHQGRSKRRRSSCLVTDGCPPVTSDDDAGRGHVAGPLVSLSIGREDGDRELMSVDTAHPHLVDTPLLGDQLPARTPAGPHQRPSPEHGVLCRRSRQPRPPRRRWRCRPVLEGNDNQPGGYQAHEHTGYRCHHALDHLDLHPSIWAHRTVLAVVSMPPILIVTIEPRHRPSPDVTCCDRPLAYPVGLIADGELGQHGSCA